jgi:hypothetical protein
VNGIASGSSQVAPSVAGATSAAGAAVDWSKVDEAFGKKGGMRPGEVYKFGLPRSDLSVTFDGVTLKPALAPGSHLEFKMMATSAMLMGDLDLTGNEVSPTVKKPIEGGVDITAVHNHLLRTQPAVLYMHVGGVVDSSS